MRTNGDRSEWFATREVQGLGDDGDRDVVTVWIERRPGAVWAVGRAVGLAQRADGAVRTDDYVFEGYEMGDALGAANEALRSDLEVSSGDGVDQDVREFSEEELRGPLERWFFGRR
jgi:hypothetical protein